MQASSKILTDNLRRDRDAVLWGLLLEKLLENINAAIMIVNSRGHIVFANEWYLRFFGKNENEVINRSWIESIVPSGQRRKVQKIFERIKQQKSLLKIDTPCFSKRKIKSICWTTIPLVDEWSSFYMFIGWTEKKLARCLSGMHPTTPHSLDKAYYEVIEVLFSASRIAEPSTAEHSNRVMSIAVALANRLHLAKRRIKKLKVACMLHDLGKLALDERILFKKGRLTKREFYQAKKHALWGVGIVRLFYFLRDIVPIMESHHENFDGTGYPYGLKGEEIPIESQVLSIADVYEALTADRPYRKGYPKKAAVGIMENEKGRKFDPKMIDIFFDMIKRGNL